ncbi:MAG: C13 family peptidase [Burkholderiales bacterium]
MRPNFRELAANLKAGLCLALFLRTPEFHVSGDQLVLLAVVYLLLIFALDFIGNGLPGEFDLSAAPGSLFFVLLLLFAGYVIARWQHHSKLALAVPIMALSPAPVFAALYLVLSALETFGVYEILGIGDAWGFYFLLLFQFVVYARGLAVIAGKTRLAANAAWLLGLAVIPQIIFPRGELWVAISPESNDAMLPAITDESVFHLQPALLERALAGLANERPGVADLYFIGLGGDASQDVFMKELQFAQALFDSRFDTKGRSLALINNRNTLRHTPVGTATNLAVAIQAVAHKMNRAEDVLIIFITSHGSENHELSVVLDPMELEQIEPDFLREELGKAGIEWRIIIVSACYSGGFIAPLKNEKSLIVTAANANQPSFGCSADADLTYFGRAFFAEELARTHSFAQAFDRAVLSIGEREKEKGFDASHPQIEMGAQMKEKLAQLEARLKASAEGGVRPAPERSLP